MVFDNVTLFIDEKVVKALGMTLDEFADVWFERAENDAEFRKKLDDGGARVYEKVKGSPTMGIEEFYQDHIHK